MTGLPIPLVVWGLLALAALCLLAAWIGIALLIFGRLAARESRPGYVHPPSTEAMAAQTDRRTV